LSSPKRLEPGCSPPSGDGPLAPEGAGRGAPAKGKVEAWFEACQKLKRELLLARYQG
jgi:hypothetical protein